MNMDDDWGYPKSWMVEFMKAMGAPIAGWLSSWKKSQSRNRWFGELIFKVSIAMGVPQCWKPPSTHLQGSHQGICAAAEIGGFSKLSSRPWDGHG